VRAARAGQQSVGGVEETGASSQPVPQSQD
jgi:hypothetical protein